MASIQEVTIDRLISYLDSIIVNCRVKVDGEYQTVDIFKTTIEGDKIKKYIYLDEVDGLIEEARLMSNNNESLAIENYSTTHQNDGLMIVFEFRLSIQ